MSEKQREGNIFTEEGRLLQAEYAIKNVGEAGTVMGVVCTNGIVLIGVNPSKSASVEKIYKVNDNAQVAVSGIFSDALRILKYARVKSLEIEEEIGKSPKISVLCELISREKQYYTQIVSARPFGVVFLYTGYENDEYVLYSTDPSGTINKWKACAFGMDSDSINSSLRGEIATIECNVDEGIYKLLRIYGKIKEWSTDLSERLEILRFVKDEYRLLKADEINEIIENIQKENLSVVNK